MEAQGVRGPPYRLLHGNSKEADEMVKSAMAKPMTQLSHDIRHRILPYLHTWVQQYGTVFLKWQGTTPQLVTTEPDMIKDVLNNKDGAFIKARVSKFSQKLLGDGLATAEGTKWVRQRKLANQAFRAESLKVMIPEIVTSVEDMLKNWAVYDESKEADVFKEYTVLAADFISRTAFTSSYLQGKKFFQKLDELTKIVARNAEIVHFRFLRFLPQDKDEKEANRIEQEIRNIILGLIKTREESNDTGKLDGYGNDLFGLLLKANHEHEDDKRISVDDIIDECKTFYFAGQETTTLVLSWTTLLLAINTEWQEMAREEAFEIFGGKHPTSNDTGKIAKLKAMTMIINEALRLYTPPVVFVRQAVKEVKLGRFTVPKDMQIFMSAIPTHHDKNLWGDDVHLFRPERFKDGIAGATTNNMTSFFPFGAGPRFCVGQGLAMMEVKIALSMVLQKYTFTLSPAYIHAPTRLITTKPQHGIQLMIHKL